LEFEKIGLELLYDAIDVKNVTMLMPGAVVIVGWETAWFSQSAVIPGLKEAAVASGTVPAKQSFYNYKKEQLDSYKRWFEQQKRSK
jgi:hypothetical protein